MTGKIVINGIGASPGIAVGPVYIAGPQEYAGRRYKIPEAAVTKEVERFHKAVQQTKEQLKEISKKMVLQFGREHSSIFDAQGMFLDDPSLINDVVSGIKKDRLNAETVVLEVLKKMHDVFAAMEDEYLKERGMDIEDVGRRLLKNLTSSEKKAIQEVDTDVIVIAKDLTPSDTAQLNKEFIRGFATDMGGPTSHTAIMARSLEIPAVVGLKEVTAKIKDGDILVVDGLQGLVIINPDSNTLAHYSQEEQKYKTRQKELKKLRKLPAETLDGYRLLLSANIEMPQDVKAALENGAEGVGLFRTEFLFMNAEKTPTEDEQYDAYQTVIKSIFPNTVVIRTMDVGGDKKINFLEIPPEANPSLGLRSIRLSLRHPEVFKTQLRAILRASVHGKVKIMYPMISGVEEFRSANKLLEEVKDGLHKQKIPFDSNIEVGCMIELPSAVMVADVLAKEADFFSIGSNDLIQYSFGVDRVNENVAYLYDPFQPAILRLLKMTVEAAHREGIHVSLCGEIGGDPLFTLLLLGLGLDELSTAAVHISEIKQSIRSTTFSEAKDIANRVLSFGTSREVTEFLKKRAVDTSIKQ